MKRAVLALSLAALSAMPAAAQAPMSWSAIDTDSGAMLVFGPTGADDGILTFTCDKGNPNALISSRIGSKGLKPDEAARILLSAGKVKKEFSGKAVTEAGSSAVEVDAGGKLADIRAVLAGGKSMTLEVKGAKQPVNLTGALDAFAAFEASCQ